MTKEEVIRRLNAPGVNRAQISRDTGIRAMYLWELAHDRIKDPGSRKLDTLRAYFLSRDLSREVAQ